MLLHLEIYAYKMGLNQHALFQNLLKMEMSELTNGGEVLKLQG